MTILYIHRTKGFLSGLSFILWVITSKHYGSITPPPIRCPPPKKKRENNWYNSLFARFTCINIIRKHCPNHPRANCFYGWWTELVMWGICVAELTKDKLWQLPPRAGSRLFYGFFGGREAKSWKWKIWWIWSFKMANKKQKYFDWWNIENIENITDKRQVMTVAAESGQPSISQLFLKVGSKIFLDNLFIVYIIFCCRL